MRTTLFFYAVIFFAGNSIAQGFVPAGPVTIASGQGNYHPQIEVFGDNQVGVIWTSQTTDDLFFSKQTGVDQFTSPVKLNPNGLSVQDYTWSGADLCTSGDNVYVMFRSLGFETGHVYVVKSTDNGLTWGDTVRVDNFTGYYGQFPDVAVYQDTVYVAMMKRPMGGGHEAEYVVARSVDGGASFEADVDVTAALGSEACDCCQPEVIVDANRVIVVYRRNLLDTRDIKAIVSHDRGQTFSQYISLDNHNWTVAACPSTGPDARFLSNDIFATIYRTTVSGQPKIFVNEYNLTTDATVNEVDVFISSATNTGINYPQMAYGDNNLAIVWEGLGLSTDIFFNASATGASGLLPANGINVTNIVGSQSKPDIAISNGSYHVVYAETSGNQVKYVRVETFNEISNAVSDFEISIYPNPAQNKVAIDLTPFQNTQTKIGIYTTNGVLVKELTQVATNGLVELDISELSPAVYFIQVSNEEYTGTNRLVKN